MQKINLIPPIVLEILKFKNAAIWLAKSIFAFNLRTRFFPDLRFYRIIKVIMVHDLNPKILHINRLFLLQNPKETHSFGVFWGIILKNEIFSHKSDSVSFLPLQHTNFMRSFRKILSRFGKNKFTYWHTDKLTVVKS